MVVLQVRVTGPSSSSVSTTINTDRHAQHIQTDQHFCVILYYIIVKLRHTIFWKFAESMFCCDADEQEAEYPQ